MLELLLNPLNDAIHILIIIGFEPVVVLACKIILFIFMFKSFLFILYGAL